MKRSSVLGDILDPLPKLLPRMEHFGSGVMGYNIPVQLNYTKPI
jgi:hypothetical protein